MKRIWRVLLSRRYAVLAMALLTAIMLLAALVPEQETAEGLRRRGGAEAWILERLRPDALVRSPVFLGVAAYVALAVAASMVFRIRAHVAARREADRTVMQRFVARRLVHLVVPPAEAERRVVEILRREGLPAGGGLTGARGASGFWGSMLFHLGLLVTLVGVAVSARERFNGELVLVEGFPRDLSPQALLRASPLSAAESLRGTRIAVEAVSASYASGTQLTDVSASLTVERTGRAPERHFVSVNVPVDVNGFQLTVHAFGFAPEIDAVDPSGRVRASGTVALRVLPPGTRDTLEFGDASVLQFSFYPDHALEKGSDVSRTLAPTNPVLHFTWIDGGRIVAEGRLARGELRDVGGYKIAFRGLGYWLDLIVSRDPGLPLFAIGALLGAVGLFLRFVRYDQSWCAIVAPEAGGSRVELALSSHYFPALLEERANRVVTALEKVP